MALQWWDGAHTTDTLNLPPPLRWGGGGVCTVGCVVLHAYVLSVLSASSKLGPVSFPALGKEQCRGLLGPGSCCSSPSEQFPFMATPGWGSRRAVGARGGTWRVIKWEVGGTLAA